MTGRNPRTKKDLTNEAVQENGLAEYKEEPVFENSSERKFPLKRKIIVLVVVAVMALAGLGYLFKDKIIVAVINGKPVFRYELSQRLVSSFGKETLENIIVERLIKEEAKSRGVVIGEEDIVKELDKLEKSLGGGMKLEDALKYQGVTLAAFREQLRLRLQVNRILEKDITISQEELEKYLADNAKTLIATAESERKAEAQEKIKEQKIAEKVQSWISELLAKAKINRFLK